MSASLLAPLSGGSEALSLFIALGSVCTSLLFVAPRRGPALPLSKPGGMPIVALILAVALAAAPAGPVSVAYAGSLVHVMEGPLATQVHADTGITFEGEGKGSKELAHLIESRLRAPDIFLSADASLLEELRTRPQPLVHGYVVFGSARMVIACSEKSAICPQLIDAAAHNKPLLGLLEQARVGRTDPQLDPKGARTIRSLTLLGSAEHNPALAQRVIAAASVFPEENLAVRVESGELDAGFFYSTEVPGRHLRTVELPPGANLSDAIQYGIAQLAAAPHPLQAQTFLRYLLTGHGRQILEAAGIRYFARPIVTGTP